MKRAVITLICLLSVFFAHAEKYYYDSGEDGKKETESGRLVIGGGSKFFSKPKNFERAVAIFGKVTVKYNGDLERVKKFRDLGTQFAEKASIYDPIGISDEMFYSDGEVFCSAMAFTDSDKKRITSQEGIYMRYYFNGSSKMGLRLPISYDIQVPEGERLLYIGTLVYEYEGDDFSLKRITIVDEYDEAQEEVNRLFKNCQYKLCRVDLNP